MRKTNLIIGIVIFLLVMTVPVWMNFGKSVAATTPEVSLDTPMINAMGDDKHCIYDTEYMRTHHMEVLHQWKKQAIRGENRTFVAQDGQEYEISLQNTCLECHSNYEEFCKTCHDYNKVEPNCWNCHVNPEAKNGGALKEGVVVGGDE